MTGIQCKNGHVFSMIIDSENKSAEWVLEAGYYVLQGCKIVTEEELGFSNNSDRCTECNKLEHLFDELIHEIIEFRT